ncbi:MAG: lactate utilization protein [Candidatus Omnitrophica bacterium]|nr:lactate utilization protein [Candidatus Omnitrophota bacterium]
MDPAIEALIKHWQEKNILGFYCDSKDEVRGKILEIIPPSASVGISGSVTLEELGIVGLLETRGNMVFNQYKPGITPQENLELRKKGAQEADYYLASANAISLSGELVFLSAYGNRTAGIAYAKNVIIVSGINKLTPDLDSALKRAKEYAMSLNYRRLNWDTYRPMCCQVLIIEAEIMPQRLKVILVGENLGF